jgi:CSLREA domain-containing protein
MGRFRFGAFVAGGLVVASMLSGCEIPTTIVVDSVVDEADAAVGDGVCAAASGSCTLRAAVQEANLQAGPVSVELGDGETYELALGAGSDEDASALGDLDITANVTIEGHGSTIDAGGTDRVVHVLAGGALGLHGLTITGGSAMLGGGVRVDAGASAQIADSTVAGNVAWGFRRCAFVLVGGGLCSSEDVALDLGGGLVYTGEGGGAGIWNAGSLSVWSSTVSDNTIPQLPEIRQCTTPSRTTICDLHDGAGLLNRGQANLVNVTVSGNVVTDGFGAALSNDRAWPDVSFVGQITTLYVTVANNQSNYAFTYYPSAQRGSTIQGQVSLGRSAVAGVTPVCSTDVSAISTGDNVTSDATCLATSTAPGDVTGTDPSLGPLAANGGPTRTHLPIVGSPLIDAIAPAGCVLVTVDQRGEPRAAGDACTIGAVEP